MRTDDLKKEYETLQRKLSNPNKTELCLNRREFASASKRLAFLQGVIDKIREEEKIEKNLKDNKEILRESTDEDLKKLANQDIEDLQKKKSYIEKEIEGMLNPPERSFSQVLIEIRAAAGGEEASLFAKDLLEMYQKFANKRGWMVNILAASYSDLAGIKEISFEIKGRKVEEELRYESGVHRVQRIPATEKSGRIHTSTVSVAVLPIAEEKEMNIRPQDLKIEVYHSSGPGGQYVNKRESAVRITHIPTGTVVTSQTSRTQVANRNNAMKVLKARIFQKTREDAEKKIGEARKTQIGSGDRAEKIRTYNFPQDRITYHRFKKSWKHIAEILEGNLDEITEEFKK